jgi:predicted amidophosphoribosyltransferase
MECTTCQLPYRKVWCTGVLSDSLKALIYAAKFERNNQALVTLADILDSTVSVLPQDITVTYIPTVRSHIRQRGYDHARTLAERFASRRTLPTATTLERAHSTIQRGANRATRRKQADIAFTVTRQLKGSYLLIDDVSTTGATIEAGAQEIIAAGATEVWVAVLAHQPLESEPKN